MYVDLFLEVSLPTQLGEGNLDALPAGSRYRILTHAAHVDELRRHPRLQALDRTMPVDVVATSVLDALTDAGSPHRDDSGWLMTACHREAIAEAVRAGAALLFLAPDAVFSSGTFASIVRRHQAGARAVVSTAPRLERESFLRALADSGYAGRAMPPRALVRLALAHLHAETRSMMFGAHTFSAFPRAVYWPVGSTGLLARCFQFNPLMVDPVNGRFMPKLTIDADYVRHACPDIDTVHAVTDSDEFVVFELTEVARTFKSFTGSDAARRQAVTAAAQADNFGIDYWRRYPVRIHGEALDGAWVPVEAAAERFVRRVAAWGHPFGVKSDLWLEWLRTTWLLKKRVRQAWRRAPRLPVKRIRRSIRLLRSRASKLARGR